MINYIKFKSDIEKRWKIKKHLTDVPSDYFRNNSRLSERIARLGYEVRMFGLTPSQYEECAVLTLKDDLMKEDGNSRFILPNGGTIIINSKDLE